MAFLQVLLYQHTFEIIQVFMILLKPLQLVLFSFHLIKVREAFSKQGGRVEIVFILLTMRITHFPKGF